MELLPQEVRVPLPGSGGIGRQVDYYAGEEKKAIEKAKQALKSKRRVSYPRDSHLFDGSSHRGIPTRSVLRSTL